MNALVRVTARHFVAGAVVEQDRFARAAPILGWLVGYELVAGLRELARRYEVELLEVTQ
jgi:hypothetical protein